MSNEHNSESIDESIQIFCNEIEKDIKRKAAIGRSQECYQSTFIKINGSYITSALFKEVATRLSQKYKVELRQFFDYHPHINVNWENPFNNVLIVPPTIYNRKSYNKR